ncbi:hypothetical protein ABXN37_16730 [Piscinibacter sakaiensis]|uniref:hypothetical protein n=1 Tax=Piscinibacter sakaiensis TaxID=1547922 RepID=UPI0006B44C54|nr:hypothetical protein [Piscinibacter sakaiensis]
MTRTVQYTISRLQPSPAAQVDAPPQQALLPAVVREVFGVEVDTLVGPREGLPIVVVHGLAGSRLSA